MSNEEIQIEYEQSTISETHETFDILDKVNRFNELKKECKGCMTGMCYKYIKGMSPLLIEICPCRICLVKVTCKLCTCDYLEDTYRNLNDDSKID